MDEHSLIQTQDTFFEASKNMLTAKGQLHQVGFVITENKLVNGVLEGNQFSLEMANLKDTFEPLDDGYGVLIVGLGMPDKDLFVHLCKMMPEVEDRLLEGVAMGISRFGLSEEEAYTRTLNVVLNMLKGNRKDIDAWILRELCRKTKAFAVIHNSEAYQITPEDGKTRNDYQADLSKEPKAIEVIISVMETRSIQRHLYAQVFREIPHDGKITRIGDVEVMTDKIEDLKFKGRFMDLLQSVN